MMFMTLGYNKLSSCAHKWRQYTPALITTHLIQIYPIKISILQSCATQVGILQETLNWANSFFKSFRNPIFSQIFGHQRAENEARNRKMYRGQETHPIRVNAMYEMNWANSFSKSSGNPIFGQIFGHQRAENEARNKKDTGVKRLTP